MKRHLFNIFLPTHAISEMPGPADRTFFKPPGYRACEKVVGVWILAAGFVLSCSAARAATFTWDGGGNGNLGGAANWNPDGAPPNDGSADLVFSGANEFTPNAQVPYSINSLLFSNITGILPFTVTGEKITFVENGGTPPSIRNATAYANSFSNIIEFQDEGTVRAQTGNLSFTNTFTTGPTGGGGHTVFLTADAGRTINLGAIGGTGNVMTMGNGLVRFNGANIISGTLTMSAATTEIDAAVTGPPSITVGGTVRLLSANRISLAPIQINGVLNLDSFQETIGPLTGAGIISLGMDGDLRVNQNVGTTFSGTVNGLGSSNSFRKEGSGILTLGGTGAYLGTTTVAGGTLRLASVTAIPQFADVVVETGATLDINSWAESVPTLTGAGTLHLPAASRLSVGGLNEDFEFAGSLTGTGTLMKEGTGQLLLTKGGGGYGGVIELGGGTVEMTQSFIGGGETRVSMGSGSTLKIHQGLTQGFGNGLLLNGTGESGAGAMIILAGTISADTLILGPCTLLGNSKIVSASNLKIFLGNNNELAFGSRSLTVENSNSVIFSHNFTGSGTLSVGGSQTAPQTQNELRGNNSGYTGRIHLKGAGNTNVYHNQALGSGTEPVTVDNFVSLSLADGIVVSSSRPLNLDGALRTRDDAAATWTGSGNISTGDSGSIILGTGSTLVLSGSGGITGDSVLFSTLGDSVLTLNRNATATAAGGDILKTGDGSMLLNGQITSADGLLVSGGSLALGAANRIPDNTYLSIDSQGTLRLNNFSERTGGLQGNGNLDLGSGTLTLTPSSSSSVHTHSGNIAGSGNVVIDSNLPGRRQIFSTANTYTGRTTIQNGAILQASAAGALSPSARLTVVSGGELRLGAGGQTIGSLAGDGKIVHTSGVAVLGVGGENPPTLWGGMIEGPGGLTVNGTSGSVVMTAPQLYSGPTLVNTGMLVSSGLATSDVTISSGASFSALGKHADVDCSGLIRNHYYENSISVERLFLRAGSTVEMMFNSWRAKSAIAADSVSRDGGSIILTGNQLPALSAGEVKVIPVVKAEIFSGSFSNIQVTLAGDLATFAGTVQTRIQGAYLEVVLTAPGDIGYFQWITGFAVGSEVDSQEDPDKDGIPNGIEFVLGGDPAAGDDSELLPTLADDGTHVIFTYRRRTRSLYLNPEVKHSTDLQSPWTAAVNGVGGVTITENSVDETLDLVTVRIPKSGATRRFVRLGVLIQPPA